MPGSQKENPLIYKLLNSWIRYNNLLLPEPVKDWTEVLGVPVKAENIILVEGLHHLGQSGVRELGESRPVGLEHLAANVYLLPGHCWKSRR